MTLWFFPFGEQKVSFCGNIAEKDYQIPDCFSSFDVMLCFLDSIVPLGVLSGKLHAKRVLCGRLAWSIKISHNSQWDEDDENYKSNTKKVEEVSFRIVKKKSLMLLFVLFYSV